MHDCPSRIVQYAPVSDEIVVVAVVYMNRILNRVPGMTVSILNIHRLLLSSLLVAIKFYSDTFYSNCYFASVGGVPTSELNCLERLFLKTLSFDLVVNIREFSYFHRCITLFQHLQLPILPSELLADTLHLLSESPPFLKTDSVPSSPLRSNKINSLEHPSATRPVSVPSPFDNGPPTLPSKPHTAPIDTSLSPSTHPPDSPAFMPPSSFSYDDDPSPPRSYTPPESGKIRQSRIHYGTSSLHSSQIVPYSPPKGTRSSSLQVIFTSSDDRTRSNQDEDDSSTSPFRSVSPKRIIYPEDLLSSSTSSPFGQDRVGASSSSRLVTNGPFEAIFSAVEASDLLDTRSIKSMGADHSLATASTVCGGTSSTSAQRSLLDSRKVGTSVSMRSLPVTKCIEPQNDVLLYGRNNNIYQSSPPVSQPAGWTSGSIPAEELKRWNQPASVSPSQQKQSSHINQSSAIIHQRKQQQQQQEQHLQKFQRTSGADDDGTGIPHDPYGNYEDEDDFEYDNRSDDHEEGYDQIRRQLHEQSQLRPDTLQNQFTGQISSNLLQEFPPPPIFAQTEPSTRYPTQIHLPSTITPSTVNSSATTTASTINAQNTASPPYHEIVLRRTSRTMCQGKTISQSSSNQSVECGCSHSSTFSSSSFSSGSSGEEQLRTSHWNIDPLASAVGGGYRTATSQRSPWWHHTNDDPLSDIIEEASSPKHRTSHSQSFIHGTTQSSTLLPTTSKVRSSSHGIPLVEPLASAPVRTLLLEMRSPQNQSNHHPNHHSHCQRLHHHTHQNGVQNMDRNSSQRSGRSRSSGVRSSYQKSQNNSASAVYYLSTKSSIHPESPLATAPSPSIDELNNSSVTTRSSSSADGLNYTSGNSNSHNFNYNNEERFSSPGSQTTRLRMNQSSLSSSTGNSSPSLSPHSSFYSSGKSSKSSNAFESCKSASSSDLEASFESLTLVYPSR